MARTLAANGYQIAIHTHQAISKAEEILRQLTGKGTPAITVPADITDENDVRQMLVTTLERFGHVEALVNCAGMWESAHLEDITADDVRQHFDVNTLGTFLCASMLVCRWSHKIMAARSSISAIGRSLDRMATTPHTFHPKAQSRR